MSHSGNDWLNELRYEEQLEEEEDAKLQDESTERSRTRSN